MSAFDARTYNWAKCVPEILVENFETSLEFYKMLGFVDMYQREGFAYLEYQGAQFMIDEKSGVWETGLMEKPFGRGINFQFSTGAGLGSLERLFRTDGYQKASKQASTEGSGRITSAVCGGYDSACSG